ncbi:MAG: 2-phospho-L-lactate transferase [Candidatus Binatota bacterium]|nr:2-phospho-L-lactate transferase [Candidatus Binatota bacterium]
MIVNTADDDEFFGLHVSPDLDTIVYNLAGAAPPARGWGLAGDGQRTLAALRRFGCEPWFALGDRDLATHLFRTGELRAGVPLHTVTGRIARSFGVASRVLPMSNHPVRTWVHTRAGTALPFQVYFVRRHARDAVERIAYRGIGAAVPAPGVIDAIRRARAIVLPPSNPFTSIRPILGVRGIEAALRRRRAPLVAVSPVSGGRAVRGPLGGMLRAYGFPVSPVGIVRVYRDLVDGIVIDHADERHRLALEALGVRVATTDVRMDTIPRSRAVAAVTLELADALAG